MGCQASALHFVPFSKSNFNTSTIEHPDDDCQEASSDDESVKSDSNKPQTTEAPEKAPAPPEPRRPTLLHKGMDREDLLYIMRNEVKDSRVYVGSPEKRTMQHEEMRNYMKEVVENGGSPKKKVVKKRPPSPEPQVNMDNASMQKFMKDVLAERRFDAYADQAARKQGQAVFRPGDVVEIYGLQSQSGKALNGAIGEIVCYMHEKSRYKVKVPAANATKALKAESLRRSARKQFSGGA